MRKGFRPHKTVHNLSTALSILTCFNGLQYGLLFILFPFMVTFNPNPLSRSPSPSVEMSFLLSRFLPLLSPALPPRAVPFKSSLGPLLSVTHRSCSSLTNTKQPLPHRALPPDPDPMTMMRCDEITISSEYSVQSVQETGISAPTSEIVPPSSALTVGPGAAMPMAHTRSSPPLRHHHCCRQP